MFYLEREHGRVQVGRGAEGEREERGRNLKQTPVSGEPDTGLSTPHYFMCLDSIHYPLLGYILCSFSMFIIDFSPSLHYSVSSTGRRILSALLTDVARPHKNKASTSLKSSSKD